MKRYLPKGIYSRATLILIVPVIVIQVVVSAVFIQRHYERVTKQMTGSLMLEINYIVSLTNQAESVTEAYLQTQNVRESLEMIYDLPSFDNPGVDSRIFYDIAGFWVTSAIRENLKSELQPSESNALAIDLSTDKNLVSVWIQTSHGTLRISFLRSRVSPSNPHQLLFLMFAVAILMTCIAYMFLRNQLTPITRLAKASEAFGKGQIVEYRPRGSIEIRNAGKAFLEMRERIERHIHQRTFMLSSVSHDLKTPLTRIKLGLSVLPTSPDRESIMADVDEMNQMLEGYLAFAKGHTDQEARELDAVELIKSIVENYRRINIPVDLEISGKSKRQARVAVREMAIRRLIDNIIYNASHHGDKIRLAMTLSSKEIKLAIEDNGPGIPEEDRDKALQPFVKLDSARNQNARGGSVGLGLSISNDIVNSHGGEMTLGESEDLGGLKVEILLPR